MSIIKELLQSNSHVKYFKVLAHAIGIDATIIYGELLFKEGYWKDRHGLTEDGYFYCTSTDLEHSTAITEGKQRKAIKKLEEVGLIKCKVMGMPAKRFFKSSDNEQALIELILDGKEKQNTLKPRPKYEDRKPVQYHENDGTGLVNEEESLECLIESQYQQNSGTCLSSQYHQNDGTSTTKNEEQVPSKCYRTKNTITKNTELRINTTTTTIEQVYEMLESENFNLTKGKSEIEEITRWTEIFDLKAIEIAIKESVKANRIDGILNVQTIIKDWIKKKLTNVTDIEPYLEERNKQYKRTKSETNKPKPSDKYENFYL